MAYDKSKTEELKDHIIDELIKGRSLSNIIENDEGMPSYRTVFNWLNPNSDYHDNNFLHNYTFSTQVRSQKEFDQILAIADAAGNDIILDENGNEVTNHHVINRDRIRIDARKGRLGKMQPKKYGDKLDLTTDGDKINTSQTIVIKHNDSDIDLSS